MMTESGSNFRQSWLWRQSFGTQRSDSTPEEQEFFKTQYISIRERAALLVSRIAVDLPGMTVHDISHLDALWETASSVAEGAIPVNPAEAFVLGASILLHDAAMSLSAFPGGLVQVRATVIWKDAVARAALAIKESGGNLIDEVDPPESVVQQILPDVLRRLHAEHAEVLAEQAWLSAEGEQVYLIEDSELRYFYGPTIGQIAHSHWWSVHKIEQELSVELGALAQRTRHVVDRVKLACLLRVADALHLDSRRAPRFLRILSNPTGVSARHWSFQERLARPHIELDAVVFTTGQPFGRSEAEAWWLAYDTLNAVDRELRDVDLLLQGRGREVLKARRVKGAGSPELLSKMVKTRDWRPVDTRLQVSDVPRIVESLGGTKLYGENPAVALRELLQNAADAVQARRKLQRRLSDWGQIKISLEKRQEDFWLVVEDTGIGMSEQVLTGPLLDFGTSFWRSPMAMEEFPGLMAAGMRPIGRFGIGFFAVFMLGATVRVLSRRYDKGQDAGRLLEFRGGTSARPILSQSEPDDTPIDGGTRVEVLLRKHPLRAGGLLSAGLYSGTTIPLAKLVAAVAPNLDVALVATMDDVYEQVVQPGDWLKINDLALVARLNPLMEGSDVEAREVNRELMRQIESPDGTVFGRAFISPSKYTYSTDGGWVTISGLRAVQLLNVQGVLLGEAITAARDTAQPLVTKEALEKWATSQASLISTAVLDEVHQAKSAEVVLECGGDIGDLKVLKWGSSWLNISEFRERLSVAAEFAVYFDGELEYDEERDQVHPKEFREEFEQNKDIALVLRFDGSILRMGSQKWPKSLMGIPRASYSNIETLVRREIASAWEGYQSCEEERVVGEVGDVDIRRKVTIFTPGDGAIDD
jgi:hypothetical protein